MYRRKKPLNQFSAPARKKRFPAHSSSSFEFFFAPKRRSDPAFFATFNKNHPLCHNLLQPLVAISRSGPIVGASLGFSAFVNVNWFLSRCFRVMNFATPVCENRFDSSRKCDDSVGVATNSEYLLTACNICLYFPFAPLREFTVLYETLMTWVFCRTGASSLPAEGQNTNEVRQRRPSTALMARRQIHSLLPPPVPTSLEAPLRLREDGNLQRQSQETHAPHPRQSRGHLFPFPPANWPSATKFDGRHHRSHHSGRWATKNLRTFAADLARPLHPGASRPYHQTQGPHRRRKRHS